MTLRVHLASRTIMPLSEACRYFAQVARDVEKRLAHAQPCFVHPSSLHIDPQGKPALGAPQPATDPRDKACAPPEGPERPVDARGAVYAIGAMFYEATTGVVVGPGMKRPVELGLPPSVETILKRALLPDPAGRPGDLAALASALEQLAHTTVTSMPPGGYDIAMSAAPPQYDVAFSAPPGPVPVPMVEPVVAAPSSARNAAPPSSRRNVDPYGNIIIDKVAAQPARPTATEELVQLKARLESDPTPRYVVSKDFMDHGPFTAVELLQQIASHKFTETDGLRDEITGESKPIGEWTDFKRFAEHAKIHREVVAEKKAVVRLEKSEKAAGTTKFIIGGSLIAVMVAGVAIWFLKVRGSRSEETALSDDPAALDLTVDGGLKGRPGARNGGGGGGAGGGGGGGGYVRGGMSYEAAIASNVQEINMGGGGGGPDLSDAQLGAPMRNAAFISGCGAGDSMKVTVRVAVKMGRAVGVSVYTTPPDGAVSGCIDRHVRGLAWPAHPKMDSFTTAY